MRAHNRDDALVETQGETRTYNYSLYEFFSVRKPFVVLQWGNAVESGRTTETVR